MTQIVAIGIATLFCSSAAQADIVITKVGTPAYDLVDIHLYAAPGNGSFQLMFPDHFPRILHDGYSTEFTDGLAITGFQEKQVFSVDDFTDPMAAHLGWALVPNALASNGSSFDFSDGPIIPIATQPISLVGDVFLNGVPFELSAWGFDLQTNDGTDGVSHFIMDLWENSAYAPAGLTSLVGDYEYRVTLRDTGGNGYDILARFTVADVPVGVPGDANGDGSFDFGDIEALFLAVTDLPAYAAQYPDVSVLLLDMNQDGNTDFGDIEAFFNALTG